MIRNPAQYKVLIVDDDERTRSGLARILNEYTFELAEDGAAALSMLREFRPDLILLDVQMPGLDGYEVCRQIRQDPCNRFVKIVFLSGENKPIADRLEGYAAGGDEYLLKPFYGDELLAKIRVLMRLKTVEELDQIKQEFLTLITHETKTPLGVISSVFDLVTTEDLPPETVSELIEAGRHAIERLSALIDQTLLACRLRAAEALDLKLLCSAELAETALAALSAAARKQGVLLEAEVDSAQVAANSEQLCRALSYIIRNAIEVSAPEAVVAIRGFECGECFVFEICDTGPGMGAVQLQSLFELFSVKDVDHHSIGLGISLALAHRIVELHGGALEGRNNSSGTGMTFRLSLPLAPSAAA